MRRRGEHAKAFSQRRRGQACGAAVFRASGAREAHNSRFKNHWETHMTDPPPPSSQPADRSMLYLDKTSTTSATEQIACDEAPFLQILRSLTKGRAGGEDGLAAEFVQAMQPEQISLLAHVARKTLAARLAIPPGWKKAHVALGPKIVMACRPGDYRPIPSYPLHLRTPRRYGCMQPPTSWRLAEVHHILRAHVRKHSEWGDTLTCCKMDITKFYVSGTWRAIDDMLEERHLPAVLRGAYWEFHFGRALKFWRALDT